MYQVLTKAERSPRTAAGALAAAALLAVAILPAGARAGGVIVPHAAHAAPTVPHVVGSGTQAVAPTAAPAPSPAAPGDSADSADSGQSSSGDSGSNGSVELSGGDPGDLGIPNFEFPRPDKPPSGSPGCDPGCDEQWLNYDMAAAAAAQKWADESTGAEATRAAALADSLWDSAQNAEEHLNSDVGNGNPGSDSADASIGLAVDQSSRLDDGAVSPDAVPFGWALGTSDLSDGLIGDALRLIDSLPNLLGYNGTTVCTKKGTPDGKVPICPK